MGEGCVLSSVNFLNKISRANGLLVQSNDHVSCARPGNGSCSLCRDLAQKQLLEVWRYVR